MKYLFMIFLFASVAPLGVAEKQIKKTPEPRVTYELYSWRDNNGVWSFSIMETTSRQKTIEEIFDEKQAIHGVDNLKRKISHLARPSRLVWFDKLIFNGRPVPGTERLRWPPKEIIEDVKRYSAARHVEVSGVE
jgi:hypothetical protein